MRGRAGVAKDMHGEVAHRARDPRAIKVEGRELRGADVLAGIHLHAVDHGKKIISAQPIPLGRLAQRARDQIVRASPIDRVDLVAPIRESGELGLDRALPVGDVVDLAAKCVYRVHPVAAVLRQ